VFAAVVSSVNQSLIRSKRLLFLQSSILFPLWRERRDVRGARIWERDRGVDVYLLADSDYAPSNPPDMIENLNPQLVVLSVAADDPDYMAHPGHLRLTVEKVDDKLTGNEAVVFDAEEMARVAED